MSIMTFLPSANMKKKINYVLYASDAYDNLSYKEYKEICEDNGWPVYEEGSTEYWNQISNLQNWDWEDFEDNMKYSEYANSPCMIMGSDGLWNGRHEIVPVVCDDLLDAIKMCVCTRFASECDIEVNDGHIDVTVYHHDGTNCYEIWLLSKKGQVEVERKKYTWDGYDYEPKKWWFKNIYGYVI